MEKKNSGKSTWKTLTINNELPDINKRCKKQIRSTGNNKNVRK
jgi:hypothetical protein